MKYSVGELAKLAGISPRTIRYYDQIGLLSPKEINYSGYRVYGEEELDLLQQILFFRSFAMELEQIKSLVNARDFDKISAMEQHLGRLREESKRIKLLISNAEKSIAAMKGEIKMQDTEKFEGFKKEMIAENERKYGKEIREKYGDNQVDASNAKMMNLSQEEYDRWQKLGEEIMVSLKAAYETGDPSGEQAQKTCELHKEWLSYCGAPYSKEYHLGLALMYGEDERFAAYYDAAVAGGAKFFQQAIESFCSK